MQSAESFINQVWYGPRGPHHWLLMFCLLPLSLLFYCVVKLRLYAYSSGLFKMSDSAVPTVVIGNITVGGTGKTPLAIALAVALKQAGLNVGVVSRGYGTNANTIKYPLIVESDGDATICGDEPLLIKRNTGAHVIVDPVRSRGAAMLLSSFQCDVVLCDDGLQHYALGRQLELGVIDAARQFGNRLPLPVGPLREPISRLRKCHYVILNEGTQVPPVDNEIYSDENDSNELNRDRLFSMSLQTTVLVNITTGETIKVNQLNASTVHAVAGIGNPGRFFATLKQLGLELIEHPKPDHYVLQEQELDFGDSYPVIMTEKDAIKLRHTTSTNLWYLPVQANLPDVFVKRLLVDIKSLIK
ncbi:MAG: tetraacyldisaccharide 4'-kinase [Hahellaceae bacterium]|nr:tetraacyldisaccharide 4'-kinase [Hahellaceae bacterium]MCP5212943.1 tetraacyldisaccharide 4'-kinase [Hahellaceae bacterium]